jgi:4-amino-4-deoxy-L-arabinose transferase-like glycosyltransferase
VLPAFPALALLIALNLAGEPAEASAAARRRSGWVAAVFWTLFAVAVVVYAHKQDDLPAARARRRR